MTRDTHVTHLCHPIGKGQHTGNLCTRKELVQNCKLLKHPYLLKYQWNTLIKTYMSFFAFYSLRVTNVLTCHSQLCHSWHYNLYMSLLTCWSLHVAIDKSLLKCQSLYVTLEVLLLTCHSWPITLDMSILTRHCWHVAISNFFVSDWQTHARPRGAFAPKNHNSVAPGSRIVGLIK